MATQNIHKVMVALMSALLLGLGTSPVMAADDLQRVDHPKLDWLFTNPTAMFVEHQAVYLEPVSVWYPSSGTSTAARVDALRADATSQLQNAFQSKGVSVVDAPEHSAIVVRVQLIDFTETPVSQDALAWQRRFKFDVAPGRLTIVAELIDAETGATMVRMADMQDEQLDNLAGDLGPVLRGWSEIVASSVALPPGGMQLASR